MPFAMALDKHWSRNLPSLTCHLRICRSNFAKFTSKRILKECRIHNDLLLQEGCFSYLTEHSKPAWQWKSWKKIFYKQYPSSAWLAMHNPFAPEQLLVLDITHKSKMATALEGRQLHNHTITDWALQNHYVANPNPNPCNPRFGGQSV